VATDRPGLPANLRSQLVLQGQPFHVLLLLDASLHAGFDLACASAHCICAVLRIPHCSLGAQLCQLNCLFTSPLFCIEASLAP